ncbi:hypothetical protein AA103196_2777 [Ameyamaea chiangmaiensis NBRC 103196]|uniref:Aspartyl protease family protein n=1 Tax=Ameyamaea chiangmaiensis TaxID=442969 RepID=A0A850PHD4_9PROT|nr:aspartyl protease family protein [Ameyamaea chiangmaiensis]MBS4074268.1 aspartyl protease family protein [Ameyamaea chiangmaiensis]NVN40581.1 aspartyl protease family protein [Ameyamaea chiangmaiensis]GBQ71439.1 hypothetical protein AA103196_2777 [Ameyamaea chiangmaiensis NBRC 103196]
MRRTIARTSLTALALLTGCASEHGRCTLSTIGDLRVLNASRSPIVEAKINGHPVAFIVDSGAAASMVTDTAAESYDMTVLPGWVHIRGIGGETTVGGAVAEELTLGSATARHVVFFTDFPGKRRIGTLPVAGLFGSDFLLASDAIVFDLPDRKINLYQTSHCTRDTLPLWRGESYAVPIDYDYGSNNHLAVRIRLNGHPIDAILDSGASSTVIAEDDARAAGVTRAELTQDLDGTLHGIDPHHPKSFAHRFDSLDIGPFHFNRYVALVADTERTLLGADFLRTHRVWIAPRDRVMYVQRVADGDPPTVTPAAPINPPATGP